MVLPTRPKDKAWQLLTDSGIYEERAELQKAVLDMLGYSAEVLKKEINACTWLPMEAITNAPKITRGDNYKGNPWMVLDYPRVFEKESVFAFRSMLLFGDALHCTFHLSGRFLNVYRNNLATNVAALQNTDLMLCHQGDPWVHHITEASFSSLNEIDALPDFQHAGFIKLGKSIPFTEWEEIPTEIVKIFQQITWVLKA